jgi:O-antigen/teichoic acid export membrane protein
MGTTLSPAHVVLLQKTWQALSGLITALLVAYFLSPDEQGYYYAIGSLLSGYILLDLGLSGLLVQVSARMFPGLEIGRGGYLSPDGQSRRAFLALTAWAKQWYARAGLIALLLIPIGYLYFSYAKPVVQDIGWEWPWTIVVISVAVSMPALPLLAILEGAGRISEVYLLRLGHYALGALVAWTLLAGGKGLFAPAMAPLSVALVVFGWMYSRYRPLFAAPVDQVGAFAWRDEIWPLQRKVALSWLAGYVFLNSPTLVVFYFGDAASAGQLGLSMVIANLLGSLCASWLIARVPRITHLVAQARHVDSHEMFLSEFKKAFLLMVVGYGVAIVAVALIAETFVARRILPPFELLLLFAVFLIFHCIGMLSVYFRARGREALAVPAMAATVIGLAIAVVVVGGHGVLGVLVAFLAAYGLVAVPGMILAWKNSRDR